MSDNVKSGKEILDDFFSKIEEIENVDKDIASLISSLYNEDKLTDANVKNGLEKLRQDEKSKD